MTPFSYDLPYPSQREPVTAQRVVATSVPIAAVAGLEMLRRGGTAADAAIATAACMTVVEPTSNGLGSDAFALLWDGHKVHGYNGSGRSPRRLDPGAYRQHSTMPHHGWSTVTVPGAVDLWARLWKDHGRLPFAELFEPAIDYARNGFLVSPQTARSWQRAKDVFKDRSDWKDAFLFHGEAPKPGQRVVLPGHARALEAIAESTGRAFYEGEIATAIEQSSSQEQGCMKRDDLAEHHTEAVQPISLDYRGRTLHEIPPNGQGIAALVGLGILKHFDLPRQSPDSSDTLHLQIEAMKLGFADAYSHVSDPDVLTTSCEELLDPSRLKELAQKIRTDKAQDFNAGVPRPGGTILLCAADNEGGCVSFIQSNYMGFGSGVVIPEWGISMQNRGACFHLDPAHPNCVAPSKRPYHTIIPGMTTPTDPNEPMQNGLMAFGVMGGMMQPQGHLQVLSRIQDSQQNPQAALDAPRFRWDRDLDVSVEPGVTSSVCSELVSRGHKLKQRSQASAEFGRGQIIHALEDGWCGASDLRADGMAVGF